ncbi:MAG: cytochrome c oxidase subunit II [Candidatus Competibacteraceae bacterium]|nr:cytochrome c oxidase subunit II [Candidatus Competibacteraceae bacterium]
MARDVPFDLYLPQASANAPQVDTLFWALTAMSFLMVFTLGFLVFLFCVRFRFGVEIRRRPHAPRSKGRIAEFSWTIIPVLIFLGLFVWAGQLYLEQEYPPDNALNIHVVAKQWMWKFQHPDGQREVDELHLPRGRPVRLVMTSQDVIHSFYVPSFRLKQDVVPGRYTSLWFVPTRTGRYRLFCAEFCGTSHSQMGGAVVVMEPEDYQSWLDRRNPGASLAAQGKSLFMSLGCSGCHAPGSTVRAPDLSGVFGRPVALSDGQVVIADESYIRDSILLPDRQVVAGFKPIMPSFQGQISEEAILKLIAYIQSLAVAERLTP